MNRPIKTINIINNYGGNIFSFNVNIADEYVEFGYFLGGRAGDVILVNGIPPHGKYTRKSYDKIMKALEK